MGNGKFLFPLENGEWEEHLPVKFLLFIFEAELVLTFHKLAYLISILQISKNADTFCYSSRLNYVTSIYVK